MRTPNLLFSLPLLLSVLAAGPARSQDSSRPDSTAPVESTPAVTGDPAGERLQKSPNGEMAKFKMRGQLREVEVMTDEIHVRKRNGTERVVKLSGKRPLKEIDSEATRLERDSGERADLVAYIPGRPKTIQNKLLITRRVVVKLAEGVTPSVFAQSTGAIRAQRPSFAPEALVLTFDTASEALAAAEGLRSLPEVLDAEVVMAQQHHVESLPAGVQYFTGGGPAYNPDPLTDNVDTFVMIPLTTAGYQWWANNIPTLIGPRNSVRSRVDLGDFPPIGYNNNTPGLYGELSDIRLPVAWEIIGDFNKPVSGNNKKILIVDDGIAAHPDLTNAIDLNNERHYNFFNDTKNPAPLNATDPHGTSLAGIAGGRIRPSGSKIAGVAPGCIFHSAVAAKLFVDDLDWAQAYALGSTLRDSDLDNEYLDEDRTGVVYFDICLNASSSSASGDAVNLFPESWLWKRAIRFGATRGRALAGVVYVTSAGNGGDGHMDVNYLENKNSIFQIPVAGVSELGRRIARSNAGAPIVCAAPTWGDELPPIMNWGGRPGGFPTNRPFKKNAPIGPDDVPPNWRRITQGIPTITTGNGYNFDFTGTSASAAMVAGVAALMLEVNPGLQARDVKEILLRSSRTVNDVRVTYDGKIADTQYRMGRLGRPLSHVYGGGLLDAHKAVQIAKKWPKLPTNPLPPIKRDVLADDFGKNIANRNTETGGLYFPITSSLLIPTDGRAVEVIVPAPPAGMRLEHIEVRVQLYHKRRGDLEIKLIAPPEAGWEKGVEIESDLYVPHRDDYVESRWSSTVPDLRNPTDWTFSTVRHWGTRSGAGSSGIWKVRIRDANSAGATNTTSINDPIFVPVPNPTDTQSQRIQGVAITYHGVYTQTTANDPPVVTSGKLRFNPGTAVIKTQLTNAPLAQDVNADVIFPITNWDFYNPVDIVPVQPSLTPREFFEYFPPCTRSPRDANFLIPLDINDDDPDTADVDEDLAFPDEWPDQPLAPIWLPFPRPQFRLPPTPPEMLWILPPWTDNFGGVAIDPLNWTVVDQGLESTADSGLTAELVNGELNIGGTSTAGSWSGKSLRSEATFSTSHNVTAEVDRVSLGGAGSGYRSSVWLWADAEHYLHFSQNVNDGGWSFNAKDTGGDGTLNPTGTGNNLANLDFADALTGAARLKLVWLPGSRPGQGSIQMWRDNVLALTHKVTNWPSAMRMMLTGQAAAAGDSVAAVFDNVSVTVTTPVSTTGASGGLTAQPAWGPARSPLEMTKDRRFMIVRDASNTNPLTNFIHARLNRAQGFLEIEPINKGKYNLYVTAENLVGISQPKLHEIVVANATYDDWTKLYWNPPTAEVAGFYADPDSDGLMNGLEFAMRLDPTVPDPGPIPDYRFEGNEVIFTYTEDSTVDQQVKLHAQVSADLQFWSDAAPEELELVNGLRTMEVRIPIDEEKLFFRLWAEPLVPVLGQ